MRIVIPNVPLSIPVLEAFLEGLVESNRLLIEAGRVPPSPLDAGVKYVREERGLEEWRHALEVLRHGAGDCEDLNGWLAGGYRATGTDPYARARVLQAGRGKFHAVCELSDGAIIDVCPPLGMEVPAEVGFRLPRIRLPFSGRKRKRASQGQADGGPVIRDRRATPGEYTPAARPEPEPEPAPTPAPPGYPDPYAYPYDQAQPGYPYNMYPPQAYGYPQASYVPVPYAWPGEAYDGPDPYADALEAYDAYAEQAFAAQGDDW
jgi:hypothetical protein